MIKIQNIYYMLAYAFSVLQEDTYTMLATEKFENIHNLFAAILAKGVSSQIKRGLSRSYRTKEDELSSPAGKINISASISKQTILNRKLVCEFDVFSENIHINQIIKTTILLLIQSKEVNDNYKKVLKKAFSYFSNVDKINLDHIIWSKILSLKLNTTNKMLISICYFIHEGLLITEEDGTKKFQNFIDDVRMYRLYERFVFEYYRKHYPKFSVSSAHIMWNEDDGKRDLLPIMKTDILIKYQSNVLIIDTKYYKNALNENHFYGNQTLHATHLYQMYSYVKNYDKDHLGNVSGVILYAKTEEEIIPDHDYSMDGNKISVKTLDLNVDFEEIKRQLNMLVVTLRD